MTIWHFIRFGSTFAIQQKEIKMKFKNIFKNKSNMTTENTEFDQELDDATIETNANGEQLIVEELSVEEQLAQDLAKEKISFWDYLLNLKITKRTSKERLELFKTANQEVLLAMLPVLDDFDRAAVEINKSDDENLKKVLN